MIIGLFLIGSLFGFVSAITSMVFFGAGIFTALAIWSGLGIAVAVLGLTFSPAPRGSDMATPMPAARTI